MFEVTGADIANLNDADLRTLVARLALSELRTQGAPLSSVTAGGHQDAADGGLDVRVECTSHLAKPDFVPRGVTGFQVKKPDMAASAIRKEMRPKGVLRPVFASLAASAGAYIIVCSQGTVTDKPLIARRAAIREQLHGLDDAEKLHTDFYDRERLATWANEYPGIAAWIRSRLGLRLSGWGNIGDWTGTSVEAQGAFLFDDKACLLDETSPERLQLSISEGLAQLRLALSVPRRCVRLIGMSGLGKTRLVQALFESSVGDAPLDPGLAVYTDYSVETDPTARDMARQLVVSGQRAILVVDNCNPATHSELAQICSEYSSNISLLTVEYDVQEDEPEGTDVYRLQSASPELVSQWLRQSFPNVSEVDRLTISEFSNGNFRVARAIADTVKKGDTLGKLKSRDLFVRIFQQRNDRDPQLLAAAEDLSLFYSVDGEDTSNNGELGRIAKIRALEPNALYSALVELRRRGIAQSRGRWRAVLPQAIANALASYALERIPPADFDRFSASLTPRMFKSLSRRLGYLHDCTQAKSTVERWFDNGGPLSDIVSLGRDGLQLLANVAPVSPDSILSKIAFEIAGSRGGEITAVDSPVRSQWIQLLKQLCYEPRMFDAAAILLARFISVEPKNDQRNSARGAFSELFHLYLSGTLAPPNQRFGLVRFLAQSAEPELQQCSRLALEGVLKAGHFSSISRFDFGARSRDWGWQPKLNREVWDWYITAIELAVDLAPFIDGVRDLLAGRIRELWRFTACHDAIEHAATFFSEQIPWIEGWLGLRAARLYDGKHMSDEAKSRLDSLICRLRPTDLFHQACVVVLNGKRSGWDFIDGELDDDDGSDLRPWERASQMAVEIGRSLATDSLTRTRFFNVLLSEPNQHRSFECGRGLAEAAEDLPAMWREMVTFFLVGVSELRSIGLLGGFIYQANRQDPIFVKCILDGLSVDPALVQSLPYFQARIGIDAEGVERLLYAIEKGGLTASDFNCLASGVVGGAPSDDFGRLLLAIAGLSDGVEIALDILHMHVHDFKSADDWAPSLINVGRSLLCDVNFRKRGALRDLALETIVRVCCSGQQGEATAQTASMHMRSALEEMEISSYDLSGFLSALFVIQPFVCLDTFLLSDDSSAMAILDLHHGLGTPVEELSVGTLREWASIDPVKRYPLLGQAVSMFKRNDFDESNELSPLFLELLATAADKHVFLGRLWTRAHPRGGWSGSLAEIFNQRRTQLLLLRSHSDADVRQWTVEALTQLDQLIEDERKRERHREESFE